MLERQVLEIRSGMFYTFTLRHPKGSWPRLIIQPPEGHVSKNLPEFDARAVREFLDESSDGAAS